MSPDADRILDLIDQTHVNRSVLMKHDIAREGFKLPRIVVSDHQEFKYIITSYVEHHLSQVGRGELSPDACFGEARRILEGAYNQDQFQDGYARALQIALDGTHGGMRDILNQIAEMLKRRALQDYMDYVYYHHINVLSKADNLALSRAFFHRFGPILKRFGMEVDENTFAWNTRAALEYHRQVIEQIIGIAKKI